MNKQTENLSFIVNQSNACKYTLILAHGAGAGMEHSFMQSIAHELSSLNATVIRFNFSYLNAGKKLPTSTKKSIEDIDKAYRHTKLNNPNIPVFVGGKSYGGRMSSHWLTTKENQQFVQGLIYLGFPLHPIGKPSVKRANHLPKVQIPQLFLQGTKDKLADDALISAVVQELQDATLSRVEHADHSFNVAKKYGKSAQEVIEELAVTINTWALNQLQTI